MGRKKYPTPQEAQQEKFNKNVWLYAPQIEPSNLDKKYLTRLKCIRSINTKSVNKNQDESQ